MLTFPSIASMLRDRRYKIERVLSANSVEKMQRDFRNRTGGGARFTFAVVEEELNERVASSTRSTPHGIVFLNRTPESGLFAGIHYALGNCGSHIPSVQATADMIGRYCCMPTTEILYVLSVYTRVLVSLDENGSVTIDPA